MSIALHLNRLTETEAEAALSACCAARSWVAKMLRRRPFADDAAVRAAAEAAAGELNEADWLEAFAAHPMIGDVNTLRAKYAATKALAAGEQSGVAAASEETLAELARLNREYYDKFWFIFIVCATGKTADEMLAVLKTRIGNSRDEEMCNAAGEQMKITQLRLESLH